MYDMERDKNSSDLNYKNYDRHFDNTCSTMKPTCVIQYNC